MTVVSPKKHGDAERVADIEGVRKFVCEALI